MRCWPDEEEDAIIDVREETDAVDGDNEADAEEIEDASAVLPSSL